MSFRRCLLSAMAFFLAVHQLTVARAQDLTIPNTFQPGTPASAAEVNDNFMSVKSAVDSNMAAAEANESAIQSNSGEIANTETSVRANTLAIQTNSSAIANVVGSGALVRSNGQDIGLFVGAPSATAASLYRGYWFVLSDTGLLLEVTASTASTGAAGELRRETIHFDTADCSGQGYFRTDDPDRAAQLTAGFVAASANISNPVNVWYSQVGATVLDPNVIAAAIEYEYVNSSGCIFSGAPPAYYVEVLPNDPAITGVPSQRDFGSALSLGR